VRKYAANKLQGIRCLASQVAPESPYLSQDFNPDEFPWFWQETFILAQCHEDLSLPDPDQKETDLFAGLR
jgi:hypothetical protein